MYTTKNICSVIKEVEVGEHVARIGETRNAYTILFQNLKERDHWVKSDLDVRAVLKHILRKYGVWLLIYLRWIRIRKGGEIFLKM
jgi:hypothetical protein